MSERVEAVDVETLGASSAASSAARGDQREREMAAAVVAGRVSLHRRFGTAGMPYGALGLAVSVGAPASRVRDGQFPLEVGGLIVLYNLTDMLLFGAFLTRASPTGAAGAPQARIIAATAALCGAALGRVVPGGTP